MNLDDDLHDQVRKASAVACRSINAQAGYWIRIGMLCEMNPTLPYQELLARAFRAAGVEAPAAGAPL
nr:ParD-like family protein [Mesoterricola sediminis]